MIKCEYSSFSFHFILFTFIIFFKPINCEDFYPEKHEEDDLFFGDDNDNENDIFLISAKYFSDKLSNN